MWPFRGIFVMHHFVVNMEPGSAGAAPDPYPCGALPSSVAKAAANCGFRSLQFQRYHARGIAGCILFEQHAFLVVGAPLLFGIAPAEARADHTPSASARKAPIGADPIGRPVA
jgi:hypothetical protein